ALEHNGVPSTDQSARPTGRATRLPDSKVPWQVLGRMSDAPPSSGVPSSGVVVGPHDISDLDIHLFCEGTHARIYEKLGAHVTTREGVPGTQFAVWAPNAQAVSVVGDFNAWRTDATVLARVSTSGIWSGF